jgi:hypothetical protein
MTDLIADVVERYDVDGINLDYIRTMGTCACLSCVAAYKAQHGKNLLVDINFPNPDGTLAPALQQWNDEAVEAMVRAVSAKAKALRPDITVSIDGYLRPNPDPEGRQEAKLVNAGLVDLVFDMEYGDPPDAERHHLGRSHFVDPNKAVILLANYRFEKGRSRSRQAEALNRTVDYVLRRWKNGVGLYLYSMLDENQVAALAEGPFRQREELANPSHPVRQ